MDRLVGRGAEIEVLDRASRQLALGRAGALELAGEPGIGKTRLLAELSARSDDQGMLALAGSTSELERELPFGVFVDAMDEYVRGLEPTRLYPLGEDSLEQLAHVFPSLATVSGQARRTPRDARYLTHRAIHHLLELLAAAKPLVLMLDDLHWADSGSVDLIGALLRHPPAGPVLLAMALRPRQVPDRLAPALERAHRAGTLTRVELEGLSAKEAQELLGDGFDSETASALHRESGGNPFYLQQLARFRHGPWSEETDGDTLTARAVDVPRAVAAALIEELSDLPGVARRVLEGAAVAGDPFEPELAAAASDVEVATVVEALDELLARDLVRATDVPRRFRFRHPLVRRAVYEAAPGGWRLGAHERTACTLAARGAPATTQAPHVERSARHGDLAAVAVLREAAEVAAPRTPATAARLFGAAVRLLPPRRDGAERSELWAAQSRACFAAGEFQAARDSLLESLADLPQDALSSRIRVTAACTELENLLGRHREAHARLLGALPNLPDISSPDAARLFLALAVDSFYRIEYGAMRAWARRALQTARPLDDRPLRASTAGVMALSCALTGAVDEAERSHSEGVAFVDALNDRELTGCLNEAVINLAAAEIYLDRFDAAGERAEQALALAQARGQGHLLPILFWTGIIRTTIGRLPEAAAVFDGAVEIARHSGHAEGLAWNLFGRSLAATAAGDSRTALSAAEQAVEALRGLDKSFLRVGVGIALAAARLADGDGVRATDTLADAAGGEELSLVPDAWQPAGFELLTRCLLAQRRQERAARAAGRARAVANRLGLQLPSALASRAMALVALAAGDTRSAAEMGQGSAIAAEKVGAPIDAALSHQVAGQALTNRGDRRGGVSELESAAILFDGCGALPRRDEVERELGRLGRRPHRRTGRRIAAADGLEPLTQRELQVARLVVDRRTNAEIAAELFLSRKTVETHIRHLFEKLRVSSRVDVARVVERAERTLS